MVRAEEVCRGRGKSVVHLEPWASWRASGVEVVGGARRVAGLPSLQLVEGFPPAGVEIWWMQVCQRCNSILL